MGQRTSHRYGPVFRLELDELHDRRCGTVAVGQFGQSEPVAPMRRGPVGEQTVAHPELQVTCRLVRTEGLGLPRIAPLERHCHVVPARRSLVVGDDHYGRGDVAAVGPGLDVEPGVGLIVAARGDQKDGEQRSRRRALQPDRIADRLVVAPGRFRGVVHRILLRRRIGDPES